MTIEEAVSKRLEAEGGEAVDGQPAAPELVPDPWRPGHVVRKSLADTPPENRIGAAWCRRIDAEAEVRKPVVDDDE